jgi:hypothetical protein
MEHDTGHMEADFLEPSTDLEALIGTLLLAINAQVEADESHAEWSLAAWQQWLDDEGYPIHEAMEQFCKQVATSYSAEFDSLKSELVVRLHEPNGLELLGRIVDSQQPEIAESLHQFMEQAITKADETYRLAGGTHTKAIVEGVGVPVLLTFVVGTAVVLKRRNDRLKREGLELESSAKDAFQATEAKVLQKATQARRFIDSTASDAERRAKSDPQIVRDLLTARRYPDWGQITLQLNKDARAFSKREIEFHAEKYAKGLAEKSVAFMENTDKDMWDQTFKYLQAHFKAELLSKDGRQFVEIRDDNGAAKLVVEERQFMTGIDYRRDFRDYPEIDAEAGKMARARIQGFFASRLKQMTKDSFQWVQASANAEVRSIEASFTEAYKQATDDIIADCDRFKSLEGRAGRRIRRAIAKDLSEARQLIGRDVVEVEDEIEIVIEDA